MTNQLQSDLAAVLALPGKWREVAEGFASLGDSISIAEAAVYMNLAEELDGFLRRHADALRGCVVVPKAELQAAIDSVRPSDSITRLRAEYWKAGARAMYSAVMSALAAAQEGCRE